MGNDRFWGFQERKPLEMVGRGHSTRAALISRFYLKIGKSGVIPQRVQSQGVIGNPLDWDVSDIFDRESW